MHRVVPYSPAHLGAVDEFGQGDVRVVAKDVDVLEVAGGSVLDLEAEEVSDIGGRAAAEFNGEGGCVVG